MGTDFDQHFAGTDSSSEQNSANEE